jgi:hypothetical protein
MTRGSITGQVKALSMIFANRCTPSEAPEPYVPLFTSVPDTRVPFSIKKPWSAHRR